MCGIAGYYGTRELNQSALDACLDLMQRRGPDARGQSHLQTVGERQLYLLFTRLSIIDLDERANQPWLEPDMAMVFNGEIYNYLELREPLKAKGIQFKSVSDTEVLLHTLRTQGIDGLDACEGMWAFAAFKPQSGELLLSRDRFGEKPLYLYRDDSGLYFGSEIKFIAALLGRKLAIDYNQLYRFMVNGYKSMYKQNSSFFHGVSELTPGTVLTLDAEGRELQQRYWQPRIGANEDMSYDEAVAGTRERLIRSVQLRLRADVPLAFCMSGGIDSNSLISIASRELGFDVHGFTIVNTDARYEEQDLVQHMVSSLNLRHTDIPVQTDNFLPRLRELVNYHDAPVYTITYYAHWLLQEAIAKAGYKISISGTAADELFSGYFDHHLAYLYDIRHQPEWATARAAWQEHILPVVRNPFLQQPDLFIKQPFERGHIYLNADEFAALLKRPWSEPFHEEFYHPDLLRNRMLNELFHEATPSILHEDDHNAMYYSLENRSPFLDRELFEFTQKIPTRHLIQDAKTKSVLRDAMRGIVPDKVLDNRRKIGFNAPIFDFLAINDPDVRAQLLDDSPIFEHVHQSAIADMLDRASLPNSESKFLFYFLTSKLFLECFA